MITIKPSGGLANRMRALASSYWLAKKLDKPLHIIWEKNFELNCSFNKLFEMPKDSGYTEYSTRRNRLALSNKLYKGLRKIGVYLPRGYDKYLFNDAILNQELKFEELEKYDKIFINTVEHFYKLESSFSIFKPIKKLQDIIDSYTDNFSNNTIGIHIRRTDNTNSIKYSPLPGFLQCIDEEVKKNKNTEFFLATDSTEVAKEITSRYANKIVSHEKVLDRNSEKGIEDAVIDMYCLSKCKKIIGSYYSSFSEVAAQINNIALNQVYEE